MAMPAPNKATTTLKTATVLATNALFLLTWATTTTTATATFTRRVGNDWQAPPALATFNTYEEMQNYFNQRNLRSLRHLDNPTDDTYVNAFNQHNEQPAAQQQQQKQQSTKGGRSRRAPVESKQARQLPTTPVLLKFEVSDAVEPSAEVLQLLRQHRAMHATKAAMPATEKLSKPPKIPRIKGKRSRRAAPKEPQDFQVRLIPFELADAREPDEQTLRLITHMRALDLQHALAAGRQSPTTPIKTTTAAPDSTSKHTRQPKVLKQRGKLAKRQRSKRAAPQMIKFELADAKEAPPNYQPLPQQQQQQGTRDGRALQAQPKLLTLEQYPNATSTAGEAAAMNDEMDDTATSDQSSHASKRYFFYKEAPATKAKKSLNSLPHEVQKVISHIMKDNDAGQGGGGGGSGGDGKAYLKLLPAQQLDYAGFKHSSIPIYGTKLHSSAASGGNSYLKYVQLQQPAASAEPAVQIHSVPVVEKVRYVYTPVAVPATPITHTYLPQKYAESTAAAPAAIAHPIVVSESHQQVVTPTAVAPTIVHHTYAADEAFQQHFRPSKPDPLLQEAHSIPVENYKYTIYAEAAPSTAPYLGQQQQQHHHHHQAQPEQVSSPLVKIEYRTAAQNSLPDDYKALPEFQQLSSLMGKSPEDQIHGLTYLLAKEMQTKLQQQRHARQHQQLLLKRPQDNTSPILFHPEHKVQPQLAPLQQLLPTHEGAQLIGMAKTKEYIPIVEHAAANRGRAKEQQQQQQQQEQEVHATAATQAEVEVAVEVEDYAKLAPTAPPPTSYVEVGLSPNYESFGAKHHQQHGNNNHIVGKVVHYPTVTHHGSGGSGVAVATAKAAESLGKGLHFPETHAQYASKYAFGYRIRDFHTGNDFGHKQNRDLDGVTRGQYHILLPDGRIQNVIYHADDTGFHADVSFETGH